MEAHDVRGKRGQGEEGLKGCRVQADAHPYRKCRTPTTPHDPGVTKAKRAELINALATFSENS